MQADSEKGEEDGVEREKDGPKNNVEDFLHVERVSAGIQLTNGQSDQENHKLALENNL